MLSDVSGFFDLFSILPFSFPRTLSERDSLLDSLRFSPILTNPPRFFPGSGLFFRIFLDSLDLSRVFWYFLGIVPNSLRLFRVFVFSHTLPDFAGFLWILSDFFFISPVFRMLPDSPGFFWYLPDSLRVSFFGFFSDCGELSKIIFECSRTFPDSYRFSKIFLDSFESS